MFISNAEKSVLNLAGAAESGCLDEGICAAPKWDGRAAWACCSQAQAKFFWEESQDPACRMSDRRDKLWPVSELLLRLRLSSLHFQSLHPGVTLLPSPAGLASGAGSVDYSLPLALGDRTGFAGLAAMPGVGVLLG